MEYSEIIVRRIRSLCAERGISINKLAAMSDVKQSTLDNIVRGLTQNPRVMTLHKIALALSRCKALCARNFWYFLRQRLKVHIISPEAFASGDFLCFEHLLHTVTAYDIDRFGCPD